MKTKFILAALLLLVPTAGEAQGAGLRSASYELRGGQWFNGVTFEPRSVTWVTNGVFASVRPAGIDSVIELGGRFVIPPYADAHNHYLSDGMDYVAQMHAALGLGIFYMKNPNNGVARTADVRSLVNRDTTVAITYANGGITAKGGHPAQIYAAIAREAGLPNGLLGDAFHAVDSSEDLDAQWPAILRGRPDFIKVYLEHSEDHSTRKGSASFFGQYGLDPALVPVIVKKAHAAGLTVSAHVTTAHDFRIASEAGVDEITHLPFERLDSAVVNAAARRGVRLVTTVISHKPGAHDAGMMEVHRHNLSLVLAARMPLVLGTDNGRYSVHMEAAMVCNMKVLSNQALLRIWTMDTPRAIFPLRRIGSLGNGDEASFLVLDANPLTDWNNSRSISFRMKQGSPLAYSMPVEEIVDTPAQCI